MMLSKIYCRLTKIRLQPIRVFCLHHVSERFDEKTMHACDWIQMDEFKNAITKMRNEGVRFITLTEAHEHIKHDRFRTRKYALITFDDGWESLEQIVPWLCEQKIPITLFLNPAYLLGEAKREKGISLSHTQITAMLKKSNVNIQIGSHGWDHTLCTNMDITEFKENIEKCEQQLSTYKEYVPYFAYPCGNHTKEQDAYLMNRQITPVYMDGEQNYNNELVIHRESLEYYVR